MKISKTKPPRPAPKGVGLFSKLYNSIKMNIDSNILGVVKSLNFIKNSCQSLSLLSSQAKEIKNFNSNPLERELAKQEKALEKAANLLSDLVGIISLLSSNFNENPPKKLQLIQNKPHSKGIGWNVPDDWRYLSGIYILWQDSELIYIGQSKNLHDRIAAHKAEYNRKKNTTFQATHVTVFEFEPVYLDSIEYFWIKKYRPKYNRRIN